MLNTFLNANKTSWFQFNLNNHRSFNYLGLYKHNWYFNQNRSFNYFPITSFEESLWLYN